ncbi:uncharacterized protein LOC129589265 isoform X2 [Paramacrobiotus metropolitanus]|uniref:uncharacterized protein LOC129589265 isoform X2 n=1 Tax=Paramacrobiotus metropolitanus TaxID=2943436 RepID=UPI00244590E2|nr:uncharacterized protein LOC129589265 isoform X2 [Paramacrobiotus metropolitanus]
MIHKPNICKYVNSELNATMSRWAACANRHLTVLEHQLSSWIPQQAKDRFPMLAIGRPRITLGCLATKIHPWIDTSNGHRVFIKRDDQTGSVLGGNKIRKLEFIFADVLHHECDTVITCGGLQSNHCRTVAAVAAQLGLRCLLILRSDLTALDEVRLKGNLLLDHLSGAKCYLVGPKEPYKTHLLPRMQALATRLREEQYCKPYIIPVGGSDIVGLFGYLAAFEEIILDCPTSVKNIFVACGSGGTIAGLALANYLAGSAFRIYGVTVCDNAAYFYDHVQQMINVLMQSSKIKAEDICNIIDGYKGLGYGLSTQEERDFIKEIASKTGIFLDPVYTGKACLGMMNELESGADIYEGDSLFIHTGGIFGIFGETSFERLPDNFNERNQNIEDLYGISLWKDPKEQFHLFPKK